MKNLQQEATAIKIAIHKSSHRWLVASGFIALALFATLANAADSAIGKVVYIDGKVFVQETIVVSGGSMFGGQKALKPGAEIFAHDMLKTMEDSLLKVLFIDGTEVTLRPHTNIFIEKYSQKEAEIQVTKGGIRVVTGDIAVRNPQLYKVVTPDGVVTVRQQDSDFMVRSCGKDCGQENTKMAGSSEATVVHGTHVSVKQGRVDVAGSAGAPVAVGANMAVAVSEAGNITGPGSLSSFQIKDPVYAVPTTVASTAPAPVTTKNTIVIGGPSGMGVNAASGATAISTIVIQEQTIASPYNY